MKHEHPLEKNSAIYQEKLGILECQWTAGGRDSCLFSLSSCYLFPKSFSRINSNDWRLPSCFHNSTLCLQLDQGFCSSFLSFLHIYIVWRRSRLTTSTFLMYFYMTALYLPLPGFSGSAAVDLWFDRDTQWIKSGIIGITDSSTIVSL